MRYWSACLLAVVASTFAVADPVSIDVRGGAAAPREGPCDVRMVAEDLTVDLGAEGATVKAAMDFHNEGAAQNVPIGFPQVRWPNRPDDLDLEDVAFLVDGEAAEVQQLPPVEGSGPLVPPDLGADTWYVARVPFAADQTRRVEVSYRHRHGASAPGANAGFYWFSYLLKTAGHWKGALDRLNITVNYGDMAGAFARIAPAGYTLDEANRKLTWELHDFDGEVDEIIVEWWPRVGEVRVRDEQTPFHAYLGNGWMPVLDVAGLAARYGWAWRPTDDEATWVFDAGGATLQVTNGSNQALRNGRPCELLYPARPPLGCGPEGLKSGCMVALRDLEPLITLSVERREQYLSIK